MSNVSRIAFKNFVFDWPKLLIAATGKIIAAPGGQNQLQIDAAFPDDGSKSIEGVSLWDSVNNAWGRQSSIEEYYSPGVQGGGPPPVYQGNQIYTSSTFADYTVGTTVLVRYYIGAAER